MDGHVFEHARTRKVRPNLGSLPGRACDRESPVVQLHERFDDWQAQSRATMRASIRVLRLPERFHDDPDLIRRYTVTVVADDEVHAVAHALDGDIDCAAVV